MAGYRFPWWVKYPIYAAGVLLLPLTLWLERRERRHVALARQAEREGRASFTCGGKTYRLWRPGAARPWAD